mmetsp:Transcript_15067/g.31051  ORF Transcript_15067/g.31051 Transcript_15067/m.31051 type:complete len:99 (-) Transcript_15067:126-422(-)
MIACNALAVASFLQGMQESGSVKGTALSTAANCVVSALLGYFVWQDYQNVGDDNDENKKKKQQQQLMGLGLVLLGIVILVLPSKTEDEVKQKQEKKQA